MALEPAGIALQQGKAQPLVKARRWTGELTGTPTGATFFQSSVEACVAAFLFDAVSLHC